MKKIAILILGLIILGVIIYLTFVIAVLKMVIGIVLLLLAAAIFWWIYSKIEDAID